MSQNIDPYHRFLGIPPRLQPPHHYRLLGLELFEGNADVISHAADRQMTHVRRYEQGPYTAEAQKLLGELIEARDCLLFPDRKSAYDAALWKQLAPASVQSPSPSAQAGAPPAKPSPAEKPVVAANSPSRASPSAIASRKPGSGIPPKPPAPTAGESRPKSAPLKPPVVVAASVPKPVAAPPVARGFSPIDPSKYEPPYLGEYRRRLFETFIKFAIFIFILIVGLLLFNSFLLPWLKNSDSSPESAIDKAEPVLEKKEAGNFPTPTASHLPPPAPPSTPQEDEAEAPESPGMLEVPFESEDATEAEQNRQSIYKTIRTAIQNNETQRTKCLGADLGEAFEAKNGEGGLLVALKVTWNKFGKNNEYREVSSVQPEFLTSLGYVKGSIYGSPQKNGVRFLAKQGYAIGALKLNYAAGNQKMGGRIVGLRIIYMKIEGQRLNPADSYPSSNFPLDFSVPLDAPQIGGSGDLAIGICGSASPENLQSLGLILLKPKKAPPPAGKKAAAQPAAPLEGKEYFIGNWRIYEDGRFSSSATLFGNSTARDSRYHDKGGKWKYEKDQVRILWKDGWVDVFERDGSSVRKYSFAPGDTDEKSPVNEGTAVKSPDAAEQ